MISLACAVVAAVFTRPLERVSTMDPALGQSVYESRAIHLVYEAVLGVDYRARPYRLAPGVCELPEVLDGGRRYVFRVREGKDVSAGDVVRSLERLRDPRQVSPNGWILKCVGQIRAVDERTVEMTLKSPCPFFPWLMTMTAACVMRADGTGTGEFVLASWRRNHEMRFERKRPVPGGFDVVRYLVVDDPSTQWLMFLKGELDLLEEVPRDNWDASITPEGNLVPEIASRGIDLRTAPTLEAFYLGINMRDPVLGGNRRLRQALNAAFDYPAWERFSSGRTLPADGPVPPGVAGHLDTPFAYAFNLEKARRLIAEAGYRDGIDPKTGRRLELTLAIGRASQDSRESGELIAAFYARIGIRLELAFYTWDAFLKAVSEGRTQLFRMGWVGDYPDAENFLQLFDSRRKSPGPNHSCYSNPEYDRCYDAALAAADEDTRLGHWRHCQEILREDCPWVFLNFNKRCALVGRRLGDYLPGDFPYGDERHYTIKGEKR